MLKIVKLIDLAMITIPFAACWYGYYSYQVYAKFGIMAIPQILLSSGGGQIPSIDDHAGSGAGRA